MKNNNPVFVEKRFIRSRKLGGMIKDRIKSTLDNELKIKKFLREDPKKIDLVAIEIFQRIFVEILNFNLIRGTFFGIAESISVIDWNRHAGAEEAYFIAEKEDFRVLYVRLKKLTRQAQRYSVNSIIREGWARKGEFIIVFYEEGSDIWHLVSPHITEGRNILRRYIVGMGEKHRTVSENLAKMDATIPKPLFGRIQEAFKLEPVTEKFYEDYKKYFGKLKDHLILLGIKIRDSKRHSHLFLNRLMFIYFIQKKGWIGDNKEFVKWYLESYKAFGEKNRLHEKWFNTLFFNAMNKPPMEKKFSAGFPREVCEVLNGIPYLNGGLFEKDNVDRLGIELPDSLVIEIITNFLEEYNFTITEESPFDINIAIDPAMLGRIYESLIAEEERGKAGIFYTPRIEVDFMCRLALYENLIQQRTEKSKTLEDTLVNSLLENIIEFLFTPLEEWEEDPKEFRILKKFLDKVKIVDPACGSGAFLVGMLNILQELYHKMGIEIDYNLKENIINNNLYGVDIKDWAVRMAEFRLWLALIEGEDKVPDVEPVLPNFSFKLRVGDSIVQKVGDDSIELEKTKGILEKDIKEELDKLEALKGRYFKGQTELLKDIEELQLKILDKYIDKKISFFQNKKRKQTTLEGRITAQSQIEIIEIENKITSLEKAKETLYKAGSEKLFVWNLDFPEVMLQGGYDIVIANPPYVKHKRIISQGLDPDEVNNYPQEKQKRLKKEYKVGLREYVKNYFGNEISGNSDLYVYFFVKGVDLLNPKGSMVYISSNFWLDSDYGADLQEFLLNKTKPHYIIDNRAKRTFKKVDINTVISVLSKNSISTDLSSNVAFILFKKPYEQVNTSDIIREALLSPHSKKGTEIFQIENDRFRSRCISMKYLWTSGGGKVEQTQKERSDNIPFTLFSLSGEYKGDKWGSKYLRAPDIFFTILRKGENVLVSLEKSVVKIITGFKESGYSKYIQRAPKTKKPTDQYYPIIKDPKEHRKIVISEIDSIIDKSKYKEKAVRAEKKKSDLLWPAMRGARHICHINPSEVSFTGNFLGIITKDEDRNVLLAELNSSYAFLLAEVYGRRGFGGGASCMTKSDLEKIPVISPSHFTSTQRDILVKALGEMSNREIKSLPEEFGFPKPDSGFSNINPEDFDFNRIPSNRKIIDDVIFQSLGLSREEQLEVYQGALRLMKNRVEKARSV